MNNELREFLYRFGYLIEIQYKRRPLAVSVKFPERVISPKVPEFRFEYLLRYSSNELVINTYLNGELDAQQVIELPSYAIRPYMFHHLVYHTNFFSYSTEMWRFTIGGVTVDDGKFHDELTPKKYTKDDMEREDKLRVFVRNAIDEDFDESLDAKADELDILEGYTAIKAMYTEGDIDDES